MDGVLAVHFYADRHGTPGRCCLYPGTTIADRDALLAWASHGHYVIGFLYDRFYQEIAPP